MHNTDAKPRQPRRRTPRSPSVRGLLAGLVVAEACLRVLASDLALPGRQRLRARRVADALARTLDGAGG